MATLPQPPLMVSMDRLILNRSLYPSSPVQLHTSNLKVPQSLTLCSSAADIN